jgi:hypothetical protein
MKTLQAILDKMEAAEPATKEQVEFAKMVEAKRCAAVDKFYKEMGVERTPEAIIARRTYRTKTPRNSRELAYS